MGYYTNFKITVPEEAKLTEEILEEASGGYGWERYKKGTEFRSAESYKWYECTDDMKALSSRAEYKDMLFIVEGEGEESGDIWKAYYKNGKYAHYGAIMTFPEFNEKDLK